VHLVVLCCIIILKFTVKKHKTTFYVDTIDTALSIRVKSPNMTVIPKVGIVVSSLYASAVEQWVCDFVAGA